jgi:hypothetical protein
MLGGRVAMETIISSEEPARRVFISYSTSDRSRVDGLERLLVLFGHKVFLDFKQIRLGSRWKDEIASALDQTDVTLVYWTRSAAASLWVRDEYEHFLAQHPSRPLVPIVGDETPLPAPLQERQAMNFIPVINELLELKRRMEADGQKKTVIQAAIRTRLEQAGIRLDKADENRIFRFFGIAGWMAWLPAPLVLFRWIWRLLFEATAQLSPAQVVVMFTVAAVTAALTRQADLTNTASLLGQARARENNLASQFGEARDAANRLAIHARATEAELANKLGQARDATNRLAIQAKAKEEELTKQVGQARDATNRLEIQIKAKEDQWIKHINSIYKKLSSHAIYDVAGVKKPMLMRFIDNTTGRHRFTVQIPAEEDFGFWVPVGSYRVYMAYADISEKLGQVVGGNVERYVEEDALFESFNLYTLGIKPGKAPKPVTAEDWGKERPADKR